MGYPPLLCFMQDIGEPSLFLGNPCHFCESRDENAWHNQDIRVNKVRGDWESFERNMLFVPLSSHFPGAISAPGTCTMICPRASHGSAPSEPMAANPLGISREALVWALSLSVPVATVSTFSRHYGHHGLRTNLSIPCVCLRLQPSFKVYWLLDRIQSQTSVIMGEESISSLDRCAGARAPNAGSRGCDPVWRESGPSHCGQAVPAL